MNLLDALAGETAESFREAAGGGGGQGKGGFQPERGEIPHKPAGNSGGKSRRKSQPGIDKGPGIR